MTPYGGQCLSCGGYRRLRPRDACTTHTSHVGAAGSRKRDAHHERNLRLEETLDKVPLAPFQERYQQLVRMGEMSPAKLCAYMGWMTRRSAGAAQCEQRRPQSLKPDTTRALETLGLRKTHRYPHGKQFVTYDVALRLCRALGMDPYEAGI